MSPAPAQVVVHPDRESLAAAVAARLVTRILDAQALRGRAGVVLTGGTVGIIALAQLACSPVVRAIDLSAVD